MLDRLYRALKDLENIDAYANSNTISSNIIEGLYDDLNTPKVIAELIFYLIKFLQQMKIKK